MDKPVVLENMEDKALKTIDKLGVNYVWLTQDPSGVWHLWVMDKPPQWDGTEWLYAIDHVVGSRLFTACMQGECANNVTPEVAEATCIKLTLD